MTPDPPPGLQRLLHWWKSDAGRALCTLEQIVILYTQTFPGRAAALLLELVKQFHPDPPHDHDDLPPSA